MQVGKSVVFAGYKISNEDIQPIDDRTAAIKNFPTPSTTRELKGFLGLSNQLGHFVQDLAHSTKTLKQLLHKMLHGNDFLFRTFKATNDILTGKLALRPFNPDCNTELITDASRIGLDFALLQVDPSTGNCHLI